MEIDPEINVFMGSTWTCHVCHRLRKDSQISVRKYVFAGDGKEGAPTVVVNVRYCNDTPACNEGTIDVPFVQAAIKAFMA
jgi:hypothetical protein